MASSIAEAAAEISAAQQMIRDASVKLGGAREYLEQLSQEATELGLSSVATRVDGARHELEELITEVDGISEAGIEGVQSVVQALTQKG